MLEFETVYGIEDFRLGTDLQSFKNLVKSMEINTGTDSYVKYSFKEEESTQHGNLTIEYLLTFQHNKLYAYQFTINIGSNIMVYENLIKQILDEKKNLDFINGHELKHWYANKNDSSCHKYIRLVRARKNYNIKGGISKNI